MAYFYNSSSNYSEVPDNYQYYQYYYNQDYYSSNCDSRYVPYYYDTQFHGNNAYQLTPTPPLVGYYYSNYSQPESVTSKNAVFHENDDDYCNEPVSTQYVVYHNTTTNAEPEASVEVFEEYNPKPFSGGYDINEKYGKPMSPNEKICYPTSKDEVDPKAPSLGDFSYGSVPNPYVEKDNKKVESSVNNEPKQGNGVAPNKVIHEEQHQSDFEGDDDYDDDDDDYDYDEDDGDDINGDKGGEKQDELGNKETSKTAVIAGALGDVAVNNKKEEQNVEGGVGKPKDGNVVGEVIQEKKASDFEANKEEKEEEEDDDDEEYDEDEEDYEGEEKKGEEKQVDIGNNKESPKTNQIVPFKETQNLGNEAKPKNGDGVGGVIQEQKPSNFEHEKKENKGDLVDEGRKEGDQGNQIRRQIPPGYGTEALDLCEGLFGGYFPCLWKKKQGNYGNNDVKGNQLSGNYENLSDYDYCCKETVDYLFGNPNPYGGTMPEKGSYGDPMYSYQRYYPQQAVSEEVECYGGNSAVMHHGSRYYYGYNGGYYQ